MRLKLFLAVLFFAAPLTAQIGPVVNSASFLEWDYDLGGGVVDEFRVYLSRDPAIVPDGNPTAAVAVPTLEWAITAANGQWHAVVTAYDAETDLESAPSDEIQFWVLGKPDNLRVRLPQP